MSKERGEASGRRPSWIGPVPNLISGFRVLLAIALPFVPVELRLATILTAGVSDGVDGFIARRFQVTSWQGGLLDAAADKLFTLSALLLFTFEGALTVWQLGLLLVRDIVVTATALVVTLRRRFEDLEHMQSRLAGKATTFALFGLMAALCLQADGAVVFLVGLSITCSFAAAVDYAQSYEAGRDARSA